MDAMPGVGLAAPQIGVMLRLAVVDVTPDRSRRILMANPEILQSGPEMYSHEEGSPCLPGVSVRLQRPSLVSVRFLNAEGVVQRRDFHELESTSVQHQIDHLNGQLYIERLSKMKRRMILDKFAKLQRRG